jgi:hypothetical protein
MSSLGIPIPTPPDSPPPQPADEAYDRELTRRLRSHEARDEVIERFCELIGSALVDEQGPLGAMQQLLEEAPLLDDYDGGQWAKVGQPSDARLAQAIRRLYGQAHLTVAQRIRGELSDVPF